MNLYNKSGENIGLYDVCEWFIQTYPEDVFVSSEHPVHRIRDLCKKILARKHDERHYKKRTAYKYHK